MTPRVTLYPECKMPRPELPSQPWATLHLTGTLKTHNHSQPAYHSSFNGLQGQEICGCPVLPLKTAARGPNPALDPQDQRDDIVDETLNSFRACVLFRSFEPEGSADKVLLYLLLFTLQCMKRCERKSKVEASKELYTLAAGAHVFPGEPAWPLGSLIPPPKAHEQEALRAYLRQLRETLVPRLIDRLYTPDGVDSPNKHWMQFSKRKMFGKEFSS